MFSAARFLMGALAPKVWSAVVITSAVFAAPTDGDLPSRHNDAGPPPRLLLHPDTAVPLTSLINATLAPSIKWGFEGGMALRSCGAWHIFMTEMVGDPHWIATRLGHWTSPDGLCGWTRVGTVMEGSADTSGTDERSHLDAPMVVLNETTGRFELFYVAYWHGAPGCDDLASCNGSIWRSVSAKPGCTGIGGPYGIGSKILSKGPSGGAQGWEGDQSDDSISPPFRAPAGGWLAFYGGTSCLSNGSACVGRRLWQVGLISSQSLEGPWTRMSQGTNPVNDWSTVENPVVTELGDSVGGGWRYVAVFDLLDREVRGEIGISFSKDGINWSAYQALDVLQWSPWSKRARTPQGLVSLDVGSASGPSFRLYFTAYDYAVDGYWHASVGAVTVRAVLSAKVEHVV